MKHMTDTQYVYTPTQQIVTVIKPEQYAERGIKARLADKWELIRFPDGQEYWTGNNMLRAIPKGKA